MQCSAEDWQDTSGGAQPQYFLNMTIKTISRWHFIEDMATKLARIIWTKSWRIPCETRLQKGERRDISIKYGDIALEPSLTSKIDICEDCTRDKSQKKLLVLVSLHWCTWHAEELRQTSCSQLLGFWEAASKYVSPPPPTVSFFRGNTKSCYVCVPVPHQSCAAEYSQIYWKFASEKKIGCGAPHSKCCHKAIWRHYGRGRPRAPASEDHHHHHHWKQTVTIKAL